MKYIGDFRSNVLTLSLAVLLAACTPQNAAPVASPTAPDASNANSLETQIAGTALPAGYNIDASRSLILGSGETWTGRLSYTATGSADEVFDFLRHEMPNFGWTELSAVRSDINLLTFESGPTSRIATFRIDRGTVLNSTRVDMIVAPRNVSQPVTRPLPVKPRPAPVVKRPLPAPPPP